jgi:hypothetical protein
MDGGIGIPRTRKVRSEAGIRLPASAAAQTESPNAADFRPFTKIREFTHGLLRWYANPYIKDQPLLRIPVFETGTGKKSIPFSIAIH